MKESATPCLIDHVERHRDARCRLVVERFRTVDGSIERAVVHHPGAVGIIVQTDPAHVLLVRQYRYPIRAWTWEIPAGTRAPGEDPATTAQRELEEEAGLIAGRLDECTRFHPAVGLSDEELIIYRAHDCRPGRRAPDPGELISVANVPLTELADLRRSGALCDGKTLIALALIGCPGSIAP